MYEIRILEELNYHDNYPIVVHKGYLASFGKGYGYICAFKNGNLQGFIPFVVKEKFIFRYIEMKSQTVFVAKNFDEKNFLDALIRYFKDNSNYDFISQPTANTLFNTFPKDSIYAPFGAYRIDLRKSESLLWKEIHAKHKNVIKRAEKVGVEIKISTNLFEDAYKNIEMTLQRSNMRMLPKKQLEKMLVSMPKHFLIGCSYHNGTIQSSAIILYSTHKAYYFWGGTSENSTLGANNLLHWKLMNILKKRGVKEYDFVGARIQPEKGSKLEGIQRFKKRFGATLYEGYLWKYPLKKWKYFLFSSLVKIKQKGGDIIDQEKNRIDI